MKNLICLLVVITVSLSAFAQTTETFVSLNAGLFSFRGVSATETSQINLYSDNIGNTNNPFGAQKGLSAGLSYQIQHIARGGFITGVGLGYEILRSKLTIDAVNGYDGRTTTRIDASGRSNLSNHFINAFPYVGYRLVTHPVSIDLTGGLDVGYLIKSYESGQATGPNGTRYSSFLDRTGIKVDVRPRVQLSVSRARIGAYVGYSYGLINYRQGWVGGQNQCSAELIRFGLTYKLRG